jgi:hypothetical protein
VDGGEGVDVETLFTVSHKNWQIGDTRRAIRLVRCNSLVGKLLAFKGRPLGVIFLAKFLQSLGSHLFRNTRKELDEIGPLEHCITTIEAFLEFPKFIVVDNVDPSTAIEDNSITIRTVSNRHQMVIEKERPCKIALGIFKELWSTINVTSIHIDMN